MKSSRLTEIVRHELGRERRAVALAIASTAAVALADLARPWPLKIVFDQVLLGRPATGVLGTWLERSPAPEVTVGLLSAAIVAIAILTGASAYLQVRATSRLGHQVVCRLRQELFAHLQRLSLSVHNRTRSGEMLTRLSTDAQALKDTFTESALTFGAQTITVIGCVAIMASLNGRLTLIVVATLPLLFWNLFRLYRTSRAAAKAQRAKEEGLTNQITQALASAPLIQAFGRERHETERFNRRTGEHLEHSIKFSRFEALSARTVEITGAVATALVVLFGAFEVLEGRMTPGTVLVFSTYLHGLYRPIRQIAKLSTRLSAATVSARRINEVLELAPEITDAPDAIDPGPLRGAIAFEGVSFAYAGSTPVLEDASFSVAPGERVALVGASGAGKSTVMALLLRLYDPTSGRVTIDGRDIRRYRREAMRHSIGVVLQDALLAGVSIRDNIAYGKLDATDAEVEAAARAASAHAFITRLPSGYETIVGERGSTLSGGQRQRLSIARALVRQSSILLFDEPMTGLDRQSQARVERAIDRAGRGRTCLFITHDPRAAARADRVLVLERGRIVAAGRPADLEVSSEAYRTLFRAHAGEMPLAEAI